MCYPVCGMVHIKEHLLLIEKSSPCSGGRVFPFSLSEWSFTICPTPYNRNKNVLRVSINNKNKIPTFFLPNYCYFFPIYGVFPHDTSMVCLKCH